MIISGNKILDEEGNVVEEYPAGCMWDQLGMCRGCWVCSHPKYDDENEDEDEEYDFVYDDENEEEEKMSTEELKQELEATKSELAAAKAELEELKVSPEKADEIFKGIRDILGDLANEAQGNGYAGQEDKTPGAVEDAYYAIAEMLPFGD